MKLKKVANKKTQKEEVKESKYNSLEEVMDKNRPFSIIYSGVENKTYFEGCYDMGIRNFLMSYHYLQNSKEPLSARLAGHEEMKLFIDSGAHTYQNDPKYAEKDLDYWENHLQKYLKWVEKNKDHIFAIANFDFENLVGGEKVLEWNAKYLEPFMLRTGIPVCFVWHQNSARDWEYYCKRYPYVGFSSVNTNGESITLQEYKEKLKVAEKYDCLIHGFGMTRTSMLPQLPFYTVDSTSWKAGFMYGQLAFWNGKKVRMVRKDDFEKAFQFIRNYDIDPPLDEDKLNDYYEPEVLRANVYAYQRAEESIRESLKSKMYWFKKKGIKRASLDDIVFPTVDWCEISENQSDWKEYASSFNVSVEDKQTAINCITDITVFLNWDNEEFKEYKEKVYNSELIKSLHDLWINRIVGSEEEMIEDLQNFYKDVLLGNDTKLLYLGTNFDRVVKEREEYVDDTEYEYEEIYPNEASMLMSKFLHSPVEGEEAPEISELDDEIFEEQGIIPVRDAQGRFLKGQKQIKKPKKLYSNKYPKMACDTCFNAQKCPEYKAGYVCAYNKMFDRYDTRDMGDIIQAMQGITEFSLNRLQRGMLSEMMNGGVPDPNVSTLMNQSISLLSQLKSMYEHGSQEVIRQTKVTRLDGTEETTTQVSNPQRGGILESLFKSMGHQEEDKKEEIKEEPKESEPVEVESNEEDSTE